MACGCIAARGDDVAMFAVGERPQTQTQGESLGRLPEIERDRSDGGQPCACMEGDSADVEVAATRRLEVGG